MADTEEREPFDLERANEGIKAACDAFDRLGLTLMERTHALKCLYATHQAMFLIKSAEFVDSQEQSSEPELGPDMADDEETQD